MFTLFRRLINSRFLPLLFLCPFAVQAQPVFNLDPYPVTESPVIQQIEVTSGAESVTRVGREQIIRLGAGDLSAALRRVPGVTISRYNVVGAFGGGDGGAIFIRGQGSGRPGAQIVTLTDGIPRFVGVWTHPLLDTLPTDFSASIEVFKSPQPVRFGNMAFGAVNLVPAEAGGEGWSGSFRGEYGAWDTIALFGELGFANEELNLYAGFSHRESEGHRANADGEVDAFQARAAWMAPGGWEVSFLTQIVNSEANDPEREGVALPVVERYQVENQFYLGQIKRESGDWNLNAKVYIEAGDLDWRQWHTPPPPPFPAQVLNTATVYGNHGLRTGATYDNGAVQLSGGFDFDSYGGRVTEAYTQGPTNRFNEERFHLAAPYLNAEWRSTGGEDQPQLILSAGTRVLVHDEFADKTAYQAGARYQMERTALYVNHARSYNYPGVYVSVFGRRPPPWTVGDNWRDLDPESIEHYEAGLQALLGEAAVLNLAVFHDSVRNALRIAPPPPAGRIFNLGDYSVQGAELSLQAEMAPGLHVFTGLTWLDADKDVPNSPEWTATLGVEWEPVTDWFLSGDYQFVDSQRVIDTRFDNPRGEVASYSLLNLRLSRVIRFNRSSLEVYLRGDNLLDEEYEHRPGYPMPGVSLTGGLRLSF